MACLAQALHSHAYARVELQIVFRHAFWHDRHQRPGKRLIGFAINLDIFGLARQPMFPIREDSAPSCRATISIERGVVGFAAQCR